MILLVLEADVAAIVRRSDMQIVRCPVCHARMFDGVLVGEIQCWKCGRLVKFGESVS